MNKHDDLFNTLVRPIAQADIMQGIRVKDLPWEADEAVGPECLCSRCLKPIVKGWIIRVQYKVQKVGKDYEFRYHEACWQGE